MKIITKGKYSFTDGEIYRRAIISCSCDVTLKVYHNGNLPKQAVNGYFGGIKNIIPENVKTVNLKAGSRYECSASHAKKFEVIPNIKEEYTISITDK